MNVHHKCQKKVANLCGINQKLLAEALNQVSQVGRHCGDPDWWGGVMPRTPLLEDPVQELGSRRW